MISGNSYSAKTDTMLLYFLSTLDVRVRRLQSGGNLDPGEVDILEDAKARVAALRAAPDLTEDAAWTEAYCAERLTALLEPAVSLIAEIRRRLDDAAADGLAAEPRLRAALVRAEAAAIDATAASPSLRLTEVPALRTLLIDVLEETHWANQRRYTSRPLIKNLTNWIVYAGLCSALLLISPYIVIYFGKFIGIFPDVLKWHWLPMYTALAAGLFGACFSRLQYVQSKGDALSLSELKSAQGFQGIFLRGVVGICGAAVVFFFLQSELVSSPLFPKPDNFGLVKYYVPFFADPDNGTDKIIEVILPNAALSLLIVWSFLAGFSERFVPSILSSTAEKLAAAAKGT